MSTHTERLPPGDKAPVAHAALARHPARTLKTFLRDVASEPGTSRDAAADELNALVGIDGWTVSRETIRRWQQHYTTKDPS